VDTLLCDKDYEALHPAELHADDVQLIAGLHADIQTLAVLRELGMPLSRAVVNAAAPSGRMHVLQHLLTQQQCPTPDTLSQYAAHSGNIDMLKWLKKQRWCEFGDFTCDSAACGGQLAALQYIRSEGCDWYAEDIAMNAACNSSIEVVDWPTSVIEAEVMVAAAAAGQTDMCQHLSSIGCKWNATACHHASSYGQTETLRWLRENGCP
jgi:hypothetical protein